MEDNLLSDAQKSHVPMTGRTGPLEGLGPAARACLTAGIGDPCVKVDADAFDREARFLVEEGLSHLALVYSQTIGNVYPDNVALFRQVSLAMQMRSIAATIAAGRVFERLNESGLPAAVIKGPAVERFHPAGWPRSYTDIDLLVPQRDFEHAVALCKDEGFTEPASTPQWPWFDRMCKEGVNLHSADGGNVDIHHHVPPWIFGQSLTADAVIAGSKPDQLGRATVRLASTEHSLVIACLHVLNDLWKGKLGLPSWRDIIVLLEHVGTKRSAELFDKLNLRWLLELITASLADYLPEAGVVPLPTHKRLPVGARMRIAALGWNNDSTLSRHRISFAARLPTGRALAFVGGCILPQPRYVRVYYRNYRGYWHHLLTETIATAHGEDPRMDSTRLTKAEDKVG